MAAPTLAEVKAQILRHAPHWLNEPDEVMDAMLDLAAAIFFRVEGSLQSLHDRTFIGTADGSWLDAHGDEHGELRHEGEADVDYAPRVIGIDDRNTRPAILAAIDALLDIGTSAMEEHGSDPDYTPPAGTTLNSLGFIGVGNAFTSHRGFTITISDQNPIDQSTSWALPNGTDLATRKSRAFSWEDPEAGAYPQPGSYASAKVVAPAGGIYQDIIDTLDLMRSADVSFRVIVT